MNRVHRNSNNNIGMQQNVQFFSFMNETFELFESYVKMNQKIIARFQILKEVGKSFEIDFMSKSSDDSQQEFNNLDGASNEIELQEADNSSNYFVDKNGQNDLPENERCVSENEIFNDEKQQQQVLLDSEVETANEDDQFNEYGQMTNSTNSDNRFVYNDDNNFLVKNEINEFDDTEIYYSDNEEFFSQEDHENNITNNEMDYFSHNSDNNKRRLPNEYDNKSGDDFNQGHSQGSDTFRNSLNKSNNNRFKKDTTGKNFQYFCPDCGKGFMKSGELKSHARVHSDERPYPCNICHMSFKQLSHLTRHERIHTGEKPFACTVCDKSYTRSDRLKDHMKVHVNESLGQHICNQCNMKFGKESILKEHQRIHHVNGGKLNLNVSSHF